MEFLLVVVAAAVVIVLVSAPFRWAAGPEDAARPQAGVEAEAEDPRRAAELADLEAAREAKYREIRDAELDHRTGKLSDEDFRLLDGALRAEAISILQQLDRAQPRQRATIAS